MFDEQFFTSEGNHNLDLGDLLFRRLSAMDSQLLCRPFTAKEVEFFLSQIPNTKALVPDGMQGIFLKKIWSIMRNDIMKFFHSFATNEVEFGDLNYTYIVLIPKVQQATKMTEFRPISLCNMIYKLLSKVLCNRTRGVLPYLIDPSHYAFVGCCQIRDNAIVTFECFHDLLTCNQASYHYLGLKLDMQKAYDGIEWDYLRLILQSMWFPSIFISWIMNCVSSVSFSVLINGQPTTIFYPARGLRQGDPLSPFPFILCMEGFSTMIHRAEQHCSLHGIPFGNQNITVSHIFFADDSLIFARANK